MSEIGYYDADLQEALQQMEALLDKVQKAKGSSRKQVMQ